MNVLKQAELVAEVWPGAALRSARRLTGGVSAQVYALEVAHSSGALAQVVVREHAPVESHYTAELEFLLLKALHSLDLPVPQPILFDARCTLAATPFVIMAAIPGSSVIPTGEAFEYIDEMARRLFRIHQAPIQNLPALPSRLDPLPEVFEYLPTAAEWGGLKARLRALTDTGFKGAPCLLHGDYWAQNLLWEQGRITGVLDWEDAAIGDPLSDVAGASVELRYLFGRDGMQRFIAAYSALSSVDPTRLALWQVYVAAAGQHFMSTWQLTPADEAHRRRHALASLHDAEACLGN
ncbi:phosphotransferase [Pseudomonadales bacterium]|nr:phosphotransferase [Pseudomonadales bacterium]